MKNRLRPRCWGRVRDLNVLCTVDLGPLLTTSDVARLYRSRARHYVALWQILLQKSKVASVRIFGETLKREAIDDSDNLSRVTEVAYEFSLRR